MLTFRWANVTVPKALLEDLLPGPVTVVFERSTDLCASLNPETNLIGIRIPDNDFIRQLARTVDEPLALTSANPSGLTSTLSPDVSVCLAALCELLSTFVPCVRGEVRLPLQEFETLWPELDLIVDGGTLADTELARLGSTVVDLSVEGRYRIVRAGR